MLVDVAVVGKCNGRNMYQQKVRERRVVSYRHDGIRQAQERAHTYSRGRRHQHALELSRASMLPQGRRESPPGGLKEREQLRPPARPTAVIVKGRLSHTSGNGTSGLWQQAVVGVVEWKAIVDETD